MPKDVQAKLDELADQDNRSLNKEIITLIEQEHDRRHHPDRKAEEKE
jgi:hypothetical protein